MKRFTGDFWVKTGILIVCICVLLSGNAFSRQVFLRQWTVLGYICLGMFMELLCGDLDLSFGAQIGAGAVLFAYLLEHCGQLPALAGIFCFGLAMGACKGVLVTFLRVPTLIVTFALQMIIQGMASVLTGNHYVFFSWLPFGLEKTEAWLAAALLLVCLALFLALLLKKSYFGFYCRLIGENRAQLEQMNISCGSVLVMAHVIAGFFFSVAAMLLVLKTNGASATAGEGFLYQGIVAACLGGISLLGGQGKVYDALIGALAVVVLNQVLTTFDLLSSMENFMQGAVILIMLWRLSVQQTRTQQAVKQ